MLIKFFKRNEPITALSIPLVFLVLWGWQLWNGQEYSASFIFGEALETSLSPVFKKVIASVLVLLTAFSINLLSNRKDFFERDNYLVGFLYIVFMSCFQTAQVFNPIVVSNFFMLLALGSVLNVYRESPAKEYVFNAGFFIGVSTCFDIVSIVYFPIVLVALTLVRPFVWREWVLSVFGCLTPLLLWGTFLYLTDQQDSIDLGITNLSKGIILLDKFNLFIFFNLCIAASILVLTGTFLLRSFSGKVIRYKKEVYIILVLLIVQIFGIVVEIFLGQTIYGIQRLALPGAILVGIYFNSLAHQRLKEVLILLFLLFTIVDYFLN